MEETRVIPKITEDDLEQCLKIIASKLETIGVQMTQLNTEYEENQLRYNVFMTKLEYMRTPKE